MGCYPLGKMISRAFKCNGKERRRRARRVQTITPTIIHGRPGAKSVVFSNDSPIIIMPPQATQGPAQKHHPDTTEISPSVHAYTTADATEFEEPTKIRFAGGSDAELAVSHGLRSDPYYSRYDSGSGSGSGSGHYYVSSPVSGLEHGARRREYFSGEYHYYPTPVREGIYSIATDANRLTTMFSEENPNACNII